MNRRLRDLRLAKGFETQQDLADRTGVTKQAISRLERGQNSPSGRTLGRLASAFGMTPTELEDQVFSPEGDGAAA